MSFSLLVFNLFLPAGDSCGNDIFDLVNSKSSGVHINLYCGFVVVMFAFSCTLKHFFIIIQN